MRNLAWLCPIGVRLGGCAGLNGDAGAIAHVGSVSKVEHGIYVHLHKVMPFGDPSLRLGGVSLIQRGDVAGGRRARRPWLPAHLELPAAARVRSRPRRRAAARAYRTLIGTLASVLPPSPVT